MSQTEFGIEGLTDEDRGYAGSRFADVVDALLANPYQRIWGGAGEPPLPVYDVTFGSVTKGIVPSAMHGLLRQASDRAIESFADLRWGPDRKGFRRLLHPNAVCLIGQWQITEETPYSGHFAKGSRALTVCRYSTCCTETRRGHMRSLSMVGKLFPTMDPAHATPLRTANFITQSDIGGEPTEYINDAELRNAPDVTVSRRGFGVPILLATGAVFNRVDKEPLIRQLYPVAELGKPAGQPTRAPQFMRLLVSADQPRIDGDALDFRDEVVAQIFDRGNPTPKRTLTFTIDVTDDGTSSGSPFRVRRTFENWRRIGALTFDNAVASYNGDFVIHFNHPAWREDRNDPATAKRLSK
jgi:hypothetical protein